MAFFRRYFLFLAGVALACAGRKTWKPNTNFDNPNNWDIGRIPNCENDDVIFENFVMSEGDSFSVAVTSNIAVKSLTLAANSLLILPVNSIIAIGGNSRAKCSGKVANFAASEVAHWFEPANWRTEFDSDELSIPHSEKIPCKYDDVIFPINSTFKVVIEGISAEVSSINFNGKALNDETFASYIRTSVGQSQFKLKYGVHITGSRCFDPSGCPCGNDRPLQLRHICSHDIRCPSISCLDPIRPIGFCCDICGSVLTASIGYRFHLERFHQFVQTYTDKSKYEHVSSHVYRSHDGKIVAVFVDKQSPRRSHDLMSNMQKALKDEEQLYYLDVSGIVVETSSKWSDGPEALQGLATGLSGGAVAALIFGLMATIVIAVLFYLNRHRLMPIAFSFGRFVDEDDPMNGPSDFELAQPAVEGPLDEKSLKPPIKSDTTSGVSFENPFFTQEVAEIPDPVKVVGENPGYMPFGRVEDIQASANDAK